MGLLQKRHSAAANFARNLKERRTMKTETFPIDGEKLRKEITRRGMTLSEASKLIGRGCSFLNHHLSAGYTNMPTILILEKAFNLPYDAYKPDIPEPEPEPPKEHEDELPGQMVFQLPNMNKNDLWKLIYTAVYEATKKALEEH